MEQRFIDSTLTISAVLLASPENYILYETTSHFHPSQSFAIEARSIV